MRCPFCKQDNDKVIDSRSSEGGQIVRRRRECQLCKRRFTTYERVEDEIKLIVVKKDGTRVPYEREKIVAGVSKACYKRPVPMEKINTLAEAVEEEILQHAGQEISSRLIGDLTMKHIRLLDKVAYVRFASVYHEFQEVDQFIEEAREVKHKTDYTSGNGSSDKPNL